MLTWQTASVVLLIPLLAAVALMGSAADGRAQTAPDVLHLDLASVPKAPVPGDCANWTELWPNRGNIWHQDMYSDENLDGQVSICDKIQLNGTWYHIEWTGPTYFVTCNGTSEEEYEPTEPDPGGMNPTCQNWREIFPNFGNIWHVDGWSDNDGDNMVSVCDNVSIAGKDCHIDRIGMDIIVRKTTPPVPNAEDTWGTLKSRFQ